MVRYSKIYGETAVSSVEAILGLLFNLCNNFVIKKFNSKKFCEQANETYGGKLTKRQIFDIMYELKRHKYITIDQTEEEKSVKLTNKAKMKIVEKIVADKTPDKKLRFVSFDIPERLHQKRDKFRRAIKRMGFWQIQQSLWVTDKDIGELVENAAKEYGVEDYVAYIISERSNIDEHIRSVKL